MSDWTALPRRGVTVCADFFAGIAGVSTVSRIMRAKETRI
jgi:hypothetical protein